MFAQFERFEIEMILKQAKSASHQGKCDDDVNQLLTLPKIKRQLAKIDDETLIAELKEYGAWEKEDLQDRNVNNQRIVWLAAGNIVDDACCSGKA